jgi:hypothetical protein
LFQKQLFGNQNVMKKDLITDVGIDQTGRFYIKPSSIKFPYIYREAMEVHWDAKQNFLHSPATERALSWDWTYLDWFKQITNAAEEQGYSLRISKATKWNNVAEPLKKQILEWTELYYLNFNK